MIAFALALMFWQIRAGPAAQLLAIPPVGWAIWELLARLVRGGWLKRIGSTLGLVVLGSAACAYPLYPLANETIADLGAMEGIADADDARKPPAPAAAPATSATTTGQTAHTGSSAPATAAKAPAKRNISAQCRTVPALKPLEQLPPAVIFTLVDLGPRLIAVTHHSAIAGPYHRNGDDILDVHHAFDGTPDRFRSIAAAHHAQYLLVCPGFPEGTIYPARSPNGFYARMLRGEKFDFLQPVPLEYEGTLPYQLYRIIPQKPQAKIAR
jgi:hypothetical protein